MESFVVSILSFGSIFYSSVIRSFSTDLSMDSAFSFFGFSV